ncbi:MAG: acetyl-CoA carboxylase biotin carboxyl carrier protein [Saprospiraceae bacterium]
MDLRKVKKLIELLEASQLSELEIIEGEESIRISRAGPTMAAPTMAYAPAPMAAGAASVSLEPSADTVTPAITGHEVESPTVGTFYARSSPDAAAFVSVGDTVSVGTTLCVVEAMKTFNEIQSDKAGTVLEIRKTDGDPVEFGEALFVIS